MKKPSISHKQNITNVFSVNALLPLFTGLLFFFAALTLSSCKDDNDDVTSVDVTKLVGTYAVIETNSYNEIENYTITIAKSKLGGANVEIMEFGGFMFSPVKATIVGNKLSIPTQTFKSPSTIVITGDGTLNGNTLNFNYTLEVGGDEYISSCVASLK